MKSLRPRKKGRSGQVMVEAALTLPLVVFLILGALQLFLMLQARVMAHYAVFRATRAGSVNHGDCERMTHSAILALLPTFHSFLGNASSTNLVEHGGGGGAPAKLAAAFRARRDNRYAGGAGAGPRLDGVHDGSIVWLNRSVVGGDIPRPQDRDFDEPGHLRRLEVRMIYWYPLRIPFANWVMSRMYLAQLGLEDYTAANPLLLAERNANWSGREFTDPFQLSAEVGSEMRERIRRQQYVFPIETTFTMRMLTPLKSRFFSSMNCPR
ncbi:TadE/TadG family type IV pilus assembly protein [Pyxidicoccus xibeiensis]|uniref:TadE/TadG family type IV pilus assembly protein n=1 Tax=Pyxidicoccus xibeiensis TaxID=2906759 RepID=UPI0020A7077E|nr:TadE family protein [Pyxidicoccus xibeiensis]MCP3136557.1 pilus assembly protein [Pyxidicoccus xibeiensis]